MKIKTAPGEQKLGLGYVCVLVPVIRVACLLRAVALVEVGPDQGAVLDIDFIEGLSFVYIAGGLALENEAVAV